jgi:hypothetical protein
VLIILLSPYARQFGLSDPRAHRCGSSSLLLHCLRTGCFGFSNEALDRDLSIDRGLGSRLLMDRKLLLLQFTYSGKNVLLAC